MGRELRSIIRALLGRAASVLELFFDHCIYTMLQELDKTPGEVRWLRAPHTRCAGLFCRVLWRRGFLAMGMLLLLVGGFESSPEFLCAEGEVGNSCTSHTWRGVFCQAAVAVVPNAAVAAESCG